MSAPDVRAPDPLVAVGPPDPLAVDPPDPLELLRSADHRPKHVVWRERGALWIREGALPTTVPRGIRRTGALLLAALVIVAVAWRLFVTAQPPVEDSIPLASPASVGTRADEADESAVFEGDPAPSAVVVSNTEPLVVHVAGAVSSPGLVSGVAPWRVADAIEQAGGAVAGADLDRLNLAALLGDGQRVFVPMRGEPEVPAIGAESTSTAEGLAVGPVNINTADVVELETLPGVGPATAAAIVSHRESHGAFANIDAVVAVRGIGPATLENLSSLITTG